MEAYHGSWKIDIAQTKNMDEFLKAAGFPAEVAKEFVAREWSVTYGGDGSKVTVEVKVLNRPNLPVRNYVFEMGKEIEIEGVDGDKTLSTVSWDGGKFLETHKASNGAFEFNMTREAKGDKMFIVSKIKDTTLEEVYVRC
ncbi:fatty acid-binding protein 10-A, liver basic [Aplysia californica]|uniref:Fatty acid-binding protein 10-A, liver basic n=1 Tax=Aplysia californica TaxID=6500 RepID=A0ABM1A802_APLCA|nr:fatty acid-binding protein 10-A, liver basic [Aplysia californica]